MSKRGQNLILVVGGFAVPLWPLLVSSSLAAFAWGVAAGQFKVFPHRILSAAYRRALSLDSTDYLGKDKEIARAVFREPIIDFQLHEPMESIADLKEAVRELAVDLGSFDTAYERIRLEEERFPRPDILELGYSYGGRRYRAYAYHRKGRGRSPAPAGTVIIPGSGENQSSAMQRGDSLSYQANIVKLAEGVGDAYILVKPNEDFLALHDGRRKLDENAIVVYLLNHGASYSARYLLDSLALAKRVRAKHGKLFVAGLSQGGQASLINALQSEPDKAVVCAGYSVLFDDFLHQGIDQIILPGYDFSSSEIRRRMSRSKTKFLFTWGLQDGGAFRIEAEERLSCGFFGELENVSCEVHPGRHIYPDRLVGDFLAG